MGFEDQAEQSLPRPCRDMNGRPKRTYELTSIHGTCPTGESRAQQANSGLYASGAGRVHSSDRGLVDPQSPPLAQAHQ